MIRAPLIFVIAFHACDLELSLVGRNILSVRNCPDANTESGEGNCREDENVSSHSIAIPENLSVGHFGTAWKEPSKPSQRDFLEVITDGKFIHEDPRN